MKKFVITGSVGHISKEVVGSLVKAGHQVSVITSNQDNGAKIEALKAKPLVGSIVDTPFLAKAFAGADAVYSMIPPISQTENWRASQNEMGESYAQAIRQAGAKYVVNLSSVGAHLGNGCGPVDGVADFEKLLDAIDGLNVKHIRPASFYYNMLAQIPLIKQAGIMGANYGGSKQKIALVHTSDIAKAVAEELSDLNFKGSSVRYVLSDMKTTDELANIIGSTIGKKINWVVFSDEDQRNGLLQAGLSKAHANGFTEMGAAMRSGKMMEEILKFTPATGAISFEQFMPEFKRAFDA